MEPLAMKLKPSEFSDLLDYLIPAGESVLVVSPPGLGKTSITRQAAARADALFLQSFPALEDPTDAKGLPVASSSDSEARFLPFGTLAAAMRTDRLTVWNIEDLGQATPAMQAAYMPILEGPRMGRLPAHISFVATTNRRTDKGNVFGLLEPVKSRFSTIVELVPDLPDWIVNFAFPNNLHPMVIAFLRFREELFHRFEPTLDLVNSPSARTWEAASRLLCLNLPEPLLAPALAGVVGEGTAVEFLAFRRIYMELPTIDAILLDPDKSPIPDRVASLYAVVTGLGGKATQGNFARVARYAERLMEADQGEFATLLVRDSIRRHPAVQNTHAFTKLMTGDLGHLVAGDVR